MNARKEGKLAIEGFIDKRISPNRDYPGRRFKS
jgi:hypothetical protein